MVLEALVAMVELDGPDRLADREALEALGARAAVATVLSVLAEP
jgi:hypothetical protein